VAKLALLQLLERLAVAAGRAQHGPRSERSSERVHRTGSALARGSLFSKSMTSITCAPRPS